MIVIAGRLTNSEQWPKNTPSIIRNKFAPRPFAYRHTVIGPFRAIRRNLWCDEPRSAANYWVTREKPPVVAWPACS